MEFLLFLGAVWVLSRLASTSNSNDNDEDTYTTPPIQHKGNNHDLRVGQIDMDRRERERAEKYNENRHNY